MTLQPFLMVIPSTQSREHLGEFLLWTATSHINNTLTSYEQKKLKEMYDAAEGEDKKILERILRKYGACKLEL